MLHTRGKISKIYIYIKEASMYFKYEDILANEFKLWDMLIQATQQNFNE